MTWSRLPLTSTEKERIDQLTLAGATTRAIAAELGCSQSAVAIYGKEARARFVAENPLCSCGKAIFHAGRCRLAPDLIASIDRKVREGVGLGAIGRELGLSKTAVIRYSRNALAEARTSDRRCACGLPFAHTGGCPVPRGSMYEAQHAVEIRQMLEAGKLRADIARHLGIDGNIVDRIARPMLDEMAANGATCGCGQPINHRGSCVERLRYAKPAPDRAYRWKHSRRAGLDLALRKEIRALVRTGLGTAKIARQLDLPKFNVVAVEKDLAAVGEAIPTFCICGQARNHQSVCTRPKPDKPRDKVRQPRTPAALIEEIRRRAAQGQFAQTISDEIGVPAATVRDHARKWAAEQGDALPPCACGRPARHAGGCIVSAPGALSRREMAYIEARLREGVTVSDVARETGIGFKAVLRRAWPIFDAMSEAGQHCACGRRRGHTGSCAATWTSGGRVLGPRPIAAELQQRIVNLLLLGDLGADIERKVKASKRVVRRVLATMTEQERHQRTAALRRRIGDVSGTVHSAAIFDRVCRAIPRDTDHYLRDDTIAELYLAVLQGQLRESRIESMARVFLSRAYGQWQSAFGPRSLDETFGPDSARTLGETVADDTAAAQIEQMEIGS